MPRRRPRATRDGTACWWPSVLWTDSAARFLESIFSMSGDPDVRQMVLARILRLGTEHHRWAVRDIYVNIIKDIPAPEVLMVANQLAD